MVTQGSLRCVLLALTCLLGLLLGACRTAKDYGRPLPEGAPALLALGPGERVPDVTGQWAQREEILVALERSLAWMRRPHAPRFFPMEGIEHDRALATLVRLDQLLRTAAGPAAFQAALEREFEWFKSAGWDSQGGGVLFTAYYTPIFDGRLKRDAVFRYPLYKRPSDLESKPDGTVLGMRTAAGHVPYPTRRNIERNQLLAGRDLEIAWLKDPLEAYLCHVQGNAYLRLGDGSLLRLGFGGTNGREYTSLAAELVKDGHLRRDAADLPAIQRWAARNPDRLEEYMHRNERFVFFTPIQGTPHGSLDFPVQAERSLATDKSIFPRGGPVFVTTQLPRGPGHQLSRFQQLMFDQDTGGGIRTAGRGDIYLGVGDDAGARAGRTRSEGQLYYFFLRPELVREYLPRP